MKRFFDILASLAALVVLSPAFLVLGAAVAASSRGPILFRQERVGRGFRIFTLYKFRTMVRDAERGPNVTSAGDARITSVGAILRRTKLDELPQLFNVLRGDMSFVGPRPELAQYVQRFRDDYREILTVRPGITDYAAIEYRNEEQVLKTFPDPEIGYVQVVLPRKIELYRRYLKEQGLVTDLRILFLTAISIVRG